MKIFYIFSILVCVSAVYPMNTIENVSLEEADEQWNADDEQGVSNLALLTKAPITVLSYYYNSEKVLLAQLLEIRPVYRATPEHYTAYCTLLNDLIRVSSNEQMRMYLYYNLGIALGRGGPGVVSNKGHGIQMLSYPAAQTEDTQLQTNALRAIELFSRKK